MSTRVQEAGPPDAREAIVFLHGSPDSSRDWDDLVAANGRFARTVAFDVSGYGKSDKGAAADPDDGRAAGTYRASSTSWAIKRLCSSCTTSAASGGCMGGEARPAP